MCPCRGIHRHSHSSLRRIVSEENCNLFMDIKHEERGQCHRVTAMDDCIRIGVKFLSFSFSLHRVIPFHL